MKKIEKVSIQHPEQPQILLGGITPGQFLANYWQKKPLLIRGAIPDFKGLLSPDELAGLACEEDVQSRLVSYVRGKWKLENGAFNEVRFSKLPKKSWTLLVQSLNHHLPQAADLMQQFDFIPHARLDDLMVSYAPDGGGVGPHFDSYDVFLLQGMGKRLWRVSEQQDLSLVEGAPLRILQNFTTEQEWLLEPGDMLYLPPHVAHWGIAVGECMTYSVGFRAPSMQELATQFFAYLEEHLSVAGVYADPDLKLQKHPAKISKDMVARVTQKLKEIQWGERDVGDFLGCYLSEPKAHIVFDAPNNIDIAEFQQRMEQVGVGLSLKSQALFHGKSFFINGEQLEMPPAYANLLKLLADQRRLSAENIIEHQLAEPSFIESDWVEIFYLWYQAGYIEFS